MERISIVETLNQFRTILLGQKLIKYTDHKNLICETFNTYRVLGLILILEKYGPDIEYIKGDLKSIRHNIKIIL